MTRRDDRIGLLHMRDHAVEAVQMIRGHNGGEPTIRDRQLGGGASSR